MNKPLKLIVEDEIHDLELILEQDNPKKLGQVRVRGPYIATDVKNANGRKYHSQMMEGTVAEYQKLKIADGRGYGELNHPASVDVNPDRVCHRITSLVRDGSNWIGESLVTVGSACGDTLKAMLLTGGKVGFSTRGVGDITNEGIVSAYKLVAVDSVIDPSGPGCFVDGILESKQYMVDQHGEIVEIAYSKLVKDLSSLPAHNEKRYVYESLMSFVNSIKNK